MLNDNHRKWSKQELDRILEVYKQPNGLEIISKEINRTRRAILIKLNRMGYSVPTTPKLHYMIDIQEVKKLIQNGSTINEVARSMNVHHDTLKKYCKKHNYNYLEDYGEVQNKTGWRKLEKGHSGLIRLYNSYKSNARKRKYVFELTLEQFRLLTKDSCYYCNDVPSYRGYCSGEYTKWSEYIYNGVDRFDNKKGYTIENCVTCCGICNSMKHKLTVQQFMDKINKIIANNKTKEKNCARA